MGSKKKDIRRYLQAYSAMGASFLITAPVANAAIQHTDPADVTIGTGENYLVDLDGNMTDDVEFRVSGSNVYGSPLFGAALMGNGGPTFCYPYRLSSGAAIAPSGAFDCSSGVTYHSLNYGSSSFGYWAPAPISGYLGVQFDIGGSTHYGWIHIELPTNSSVTIMDWAYEDVADTEITAGTVPVELQSFTIE